MFLTPDPPKNPVTNMIPLVLVVVFTGVKQVSDFRKLNNENGHNMTMIMGII